MATRFRFVFMPGRRLSWLQRALGIVALATLAVVAFFFLTVALVAGAILAGVVLVRLWWLRRKLRATPGPGPATYEGDFVVIERIADERDRPD